MDQNQTCYLCNSDKLEKIHSKVRDNPSIDVLKCKTCSLVCLSTFSHINESYYEAGHMYNGQLNLASWQNYTNKDDIRRYNFLKDKVKGKRVLDFGCGNGGFLKLIQNSANIAMGVEIQQHLAEYYTQNNLTVIQDVNQTDEKFNVITLFHVLEHLKNPSELLTNLAEKLTDGGEIIIEVPNPDDALISIYKNNAFKQFTYWSCHLFLFNKGSLLRIAKKAGLKVNYVKHVQRYGIANHLGWWLNKKPNGHNDLKKWDIPFLNRIYEKILASLNATDTVIISVSK